MADAADQSAPSTGSSSIDREVIKMLANFSTLHDSTLPLEIENLESCFIGREDCIQIFHCLFVRPFLAGRNFFRKSRRKSGTFVFCSMTTRWL